MIHHYLLSRTRNKKTDLNNHSKMNKQSILKTKMLDPDIRQIETNLFKISRLI